MSRSSLFAAFVGVAAGVVAAAGYHKAASVDEELRRIKTAKVAPARDEELAAEVRLLQSRVANLEERARSAPLERPVATAPAAAAAAPVPALVEPAAPAPATPEASHPNSVDLRALVKDPQRNAERVRRVTTTVDAYWREWGARYGLNASQIDELSAAQAANAKRKLDNQMKMVSGEITQAAARADNQTATDELRRKAQTLLTAEQFAHFDAEKGAEWGSSYRMVREAAAKTAGTSP